ncbi:MAG: hypothetical protein IPO20_06665 [Gammaproteobacteria bacterium]|nr:hypothetical protein [Gammaproteobacteria bacterium]
MNPGSVLPRALQAQLGLPPPPAGVAPPPWPIDALEALVIAARPLATPSTGWQLEIDIGGERVQMNSTTLLAAGTRLLLRALSPQRVRVEQVLSEPAQLQPLRNALRSDLPAQLPLREAIGGLAMLAADPALPEPLRARIGQLLAQLPDPAQLQLAAGLRAAVLNSGSFLEPRLRELTMAATVASAPPAAARTASAAAAPSPATAIGSTPSARLAPAAVAAPATGPRAALAALLRLLLPARAGPAPANAPVAAGPAGASPPSALTPALTVPLYDAQGALQRAGAAGPSAAAPRQRSRVATVPLTRAPAALAATAGALPGGMNGADTITAPLAPPGLPGATATRATEGAAPGLAPAPVPPGASPAPRSSAPTAVTEVPANATAGVATRLTVPDASSPGPAARPAGLSAAPAAGTGDTPRPGLGAAPAAFPGAGTDTAARGVAPAGVAADLKGQLFVLLEAASGWLRAPRRRSRVDARRRAFARPAAVHGARPLRRRGAAVETLPWHNPPRPSWRAWRQQMARAPIHRDRATPKISWKPCCATWWAHWPAPACTSWGGIPKAAARATAARSRPGASRFRSRRAHGWTYWRCRSRSTAGTRGRAVAPSACGRC